MSKPQSRRRLAKDDWQKIQIHFEMGTHNAKELCSEYGINLSTLHRRKMKYNWKGYGELTKEAGVKARQEIKANMTEDFKAMAQMAVDRQLLLFSGIQNIAANFLKQLQLNMQEPDPKKHKNISKEVYALQAIASAIKTAIDGERVVLNMDALDLNKREDGFDRLCDMLEQRQNGAKPTENTSISQRLLV